MAIRRGNIRRFRLGVGMAMLQGATFVGMQCWEYLDNIKDVKPWTNAYGSLFYTITGFHGLHVTVGLLMFLWVLVYSSRGRWTAQNHGPVQNVILYWHFVDAVWIFIFTSLYISPHWWP